MTINILDSEIINQIAAGEVIENPGAVVKELVENSIDAGADLIEIDLVDYGFSKIQIKDNGCGISKEDLLKAPLRHATSKIKNFDDLYNISTMGFRGEALASIFSIAKTKIITNPGEVAYEINSEDITKIKESASQKGTTIIVEDLFYNTPARKKYLKSKNLEMKSIFDITQRFELVHFDKKLVLRNDGQILFNKPAFKTVEENIIYVLGKELKGKLVEINFEVQGIKIKGFIGNPAEVTYSYKKNQFFFVNNRFIKSKLLSDAVISGFTSNLMVGRQPMYCIFIDIDPEIVDVNVHPTKIEIRFENENEIYNALSNSIKEVFERKTLFKDFEDKPQERDFKLNEKIEVEENNFFSKKPSKDYFNVESQKSFERVGLNDLGVRKETISYEQRKPQNITSSSDEVDLDKGPLYQEFSDFRLLGQIDKTYIVIQTKEDMILVDQHVAEEKYYYEMFLEQIKQKKAPIQRLLKGVVLDFDNSEMCLYRENKELLDSIGFESEEYGLNQVVVRAVPILFRHKVNDATNLKELLHDIVINKSIRCVDHEHHSKAASMACRMAVMAGDELSFPQMKKMVDNLRYLKQPFNCPHGRPTFLKYSLYDLQKKFKRVL